MPIRNVSVLSEARFAQLAWTDRIIHKCPAANGATPESLNILRQPADNRIGEAFIMLPISSIVKPDRDQEVRRSESRPRSRLESHGEGLADRRKRSRHKADPWEDGLEVDTFERAADPDETP